MDSAARREEGVARRRWTQRLVAGIIGGVVGGLASSLMAMMGDALMVASVVVAQVGARRFPYHMS